MVEFEMYRAGAVEAPSITETSGSPGLCEEAGCVAKTLVAGEGAFENAEEDGGEALEDDGVEEDELDEEKDEEAEIVTGECLKN